jgi:HNH endonuclease
MERSTICLKCHKPLTGRRQLRFCSLKCGAAFFNASRPPAKWKGKKCIKCNSDLSSIHQEKFCSRSCAASFNNKGIVRNKRKDIIRNKRNGTIINKENYTKAIINCKICNKKTINKIFCSRPCYYKASTKYATKEEAYKAKRARQNEHWQRYMAQRKNQTPPDVNIKELQKIYANCPDGHEVDHIIPISKGGLHHPDNLQYLSRSENRKKSNKLNWREC